MLSFRIPCIAIILVFVFATGTSDSRPRPRGPKVCGEIKGELVEGFYAIFPDDLNPYEADLVYCGVDNGMLPRNSSAPRTNPKNCQDLLDHHDMTESGIEVIYPYADHPDSPVIVYCEQQTVGGGWTLFQQRDDYATQVDFYRSFDDYSLGFGNVGTEFWLGNDVLNEITQQNVNELYVELTSFDNVTKYAHYKMFDVANKTVSGAGVDRPYLLTVAHYSGDAGDALQWHNGWGFSTFDSDNDLSSGDCAASYKGGWWYYNGCIKTNLNGIYYEDGISSQTDGVNWVFFSNSWESLKTIRMMTRPLKMQ